MKILVVGLGVIGSTYGYIFNESGTQVEHYIRNNSKKYKINQLEIEALDGRSNKRGTKITDKYKINHCLQKNYDFIFISVPAGRIESVVSDLNSKSIHGTIILCCGTWYDKYQLDKIMKDRKYILGYPVAGGNIFRNKLTFCLFNNFMIESRKKSNISNYDNLVKLFKNCNIKLESPHDMLKWIWLHMAINAGIGSVAGKHGPINNTSIAAEQLMNSNKLLSEGIHAIRETIEIVASKGVNLRNYSNELFVYKVPTLISAPIMKNMFAKNVLARKIMTLHGNINDLLFVYKCLYDTGKENNIKAPIFYNCYEKILENKNK